MYYARDISSAKSVNRSDSIVDILNKIMVFGDSIICSNRVREFSKFINNGCARFKAFPGANSKELLHCIGPILENYFTFYNTAVLDVSVNDVLQQN